MAVHPNFYHVDLCAGSGMLGLAVKLALGGRVRTVAYVEREAYAAATLVARMADKALDSAPVWDDVKSLCEPEFLGYVRGFAPLIVTAGYPCQPFSVAGKRLGVNDDRHLWPWIDAFIGAAKPQCVFLENVPGHLRMGFASVRRDLQRRGYCVAAGLFSAEEVGASHRRERLFILALEHSVREPGAKHELQPEGQAGQSPAPSAELADATDGGRRTMRQSSERRGQPDRGNCPVAHAEDADGRTRDEGIQESARGRWDGPTDNGAAMGHAACGQGDGGRTRTLEPQTSCWRCIHAAAGNAGGALADSAQRGSRTRGAYRAREGTAPEGIVRHGEHVAYADGWNGDALGARRHPTHADGVGLLAPGPGDLDAWRDVLGRDPSLEPAIRRVAVGLATGMVGDRLRMCGNGVVPLAASYAFVSLAAALLDV